MYYIVCEGGYGGSEYTFVKAIADLYIQFKENTEIIPTSGKENIESILDKVFSTVLKGDRIILFFDSVESIGSWSTKDLLLRFKQLSVERQAVFRYTTYYCFEEIFLSYSNINSILGIYDKVVEELKHIQGMLLSKGNNRDYYAELVSNSARVEFWASLIPGFKSCLRTRERCSSAICSYLYRYSIGHFSVTKSKLGECWVKDCSVLNKDMMYICKKCKYTCKNCSFEEKLNDLETNSVLKFDSPASSMFD